MRIFPKKFLKIRVLTEIRIFISWFILVTECKLEFSLHDCGKIYRESKFLSFRDKVDKKKKELLINTILETINIDIWRY